MILDPFDPNNWVEDGHEHRIYADDYALRWAVVDAIDYGWAVQWRWNINKPHPTRNGGKHYLTRNPGNGKVYRPKLYLHVEIMKRTGIVPPSPAHTITDHRDGNEFNCRRSNLRWATPKMNRMNIKGAYPHDLVEG